MVNKNISIFLIFIIMCSIVIAVPINTSAAETDLVEEHANSDIAEIGIPTESDFIRSIYQLQQTYVHGKYWNKYSSLDYDGTGDIPCNGISHSKRNYGNSCQTVGYCDDCTDECGYFGGAYQCWGFAYKMAYLSLGSYPSQEGQIGWERYYSLGTVFAGDIIRINYDSHSIFVYRIDGDTIYYADCNYTGPCQVRWGGVITYSELSKVFTFKEHLTDNNLTGNGTSWILSDDGELRIIGNGDMKDYPILGLYAPWDGRKEMVTSVVIDDGITSIGNYSFYLCSKLKSISIPDSVSRIGSHAFDRCENLTNITIPDSVTCIDSYAFYRCYFIKNLVIPDSVTEIGEGAFASCHYLDSIILPNSITSLSAKLLCDNYSMKSITIPDSVTSIGEDAFSTDYELLSITIPDSVTSIGDGAFSQCISITNVIIPESVEHIGNGVFHFCKSLTHIRLPSKITDIGDAAFCECYELKSISIPSLVTSIGERAFLYCDKLENVYFGGNRGEWKNVTIKDENDCLLKADISFGCKWNQYSQLFIIDENNMPVFEILPNGKKVDPIFLDEIILDLFLNDSFLLTAQSKDEYRWYSTDESVAFVEDGAVTVKSYGEANIIAETVNGARAICKVAVKPPVILGDVDGDGEVTIIDATCVQRKLASIATAKFVEAAADADEDGELSIIDATVIQRWLAQLPSNNNIGKPIK